MKFLVFLRKTFSELKRINSIHYKKSYSQSGEDLIVKFIFDRLKIQNPSYIDIGAHHPYTISNTALFYLNGSKGINIEPDKTLFDEFLKERKKDINLNIGVSNESIILEYFVMNEKALNTFSKEDALNSEKEGKKIIETKMIQTDKLTSIIACYANNKFPDFLSLDVEGFDEDVLKSIDFKTNFPLVICVETISFSENGLGEKNKSIIQLLQNNNYLLYADTNINSIFIRKEVWENQGNL